MCEFNYSLYKGVWIFNGCHRQEVRLTKAASSQLLIRGGYLVRNVYSFDQKETTGFWYVIKDKFGGIEELSSKMRNQVRKSFKVYDIRRISQMEFLRIALPIYNAALASYKVKAKQVTQEQLLASAQGNDKHFWAAYLKGTDRAVAVALNSVMPDYCCYNVLKADPKVMHNSTYPYYGLIFEMNRYYLSELKLDYVSDGARSLTEHSNIQLFLEQKFHFRKAYCKLNLVYKPWFGTVVNLLYPFRRLMPLKVKSILNLEAMYRGEY